MTADSRMSFGVLNDYMVIFGTSPAAAHVSGGAALLIQYLEEITGVRPNPAVVKTMLMNTAVNVGVSGPPAEPNQVKSQKDNDSGAGQVDLYRALLSFALTGSADGPLDSDLLTVRVPAILPGAPTMPLKATSYADQAPFDAFWLSGGDLSSYTRDTAMSVFTAPWTGRSPLTSAAPTWRARETSGRWQRPFPRSSSGLTASSSTAFTTLA